jgi:type IV fimbrial biogenesis protein FimT
MRHKGFTLIELIVVVAIAAVVLMIGIPSFSASIKSSEVQTGSSNFFTTLLLARSEAVKRNQPAVICKSADGAACTAAGDWEDGWLIYADADLDNVQDSGEEVIRSYLALSNQITLRSNNASQSNRLTYRPDGTITTAGTFRVCHGGETQWGRSIIISVTGRARREDGVASCP